MTGVQRRGGGQVPAQVMVEIAPDPERFDRRIAEYQAGKDAVNAAQALRRRRRRSLPATRDALAKKPWPRRSRPT
jgi:hypothetical protein